jgi:hypothetical protein
MKKGALAPPPELLPATRAGWFAWRWVFTLLYTAQQQKDRLPGGLLPETSQKAREALEKGGFSRILALTTADRLNQLAAFCSFCFFNSNDLPVLRLV